MINSCDYFPYGRRFPVSLSHAYKPDTSSKLYFGSSEKSLRFVTKCVLIKTQRNLSEIKSVADSLIKLLKFFFVCFQASSIIYRSCDEKQPTLVKQRYSAYNVKQ